MARDALFAAHAAAVGVVDLGRIGETYHSLCGVLLRHGLRIEDKVLVFWCPRCVQVTEFYRDPNRCSACGVLPHEDQSHVWQDQFRVLYMRCPRFKFKGEEPIKNQGGKK